MFDSSMIDHYNQFLQALLQQQTLQEGNKHA